MKKGEGDDGSSSDGTDHESSSNMAQSNSTVTSSTNGKQISGVNYTFLFSTIKKTQIFFKNLLANKSVNQYLHYFPLK